MTHILLITGEFPPQPGGVGAYTLELANALLTQGLEVSVVTSNAGKATAETLPPGLAVHNTISRWGWTIWRQIGELAQERAADWLHVQYQTAAFNMNPAINIAPERWVRAHGIKVAWTYHDLLVPYLFPKIGDHARRWITLRPGKKSNLTIVTNEGDRRLLRDEAIPNLHSIPIGSNIRGYRLDETQRREQRRSRGYGEEDQVLAYFGFLNRSKGGLTLIRALHRLVDDYPTVHLLMIGERVGASDPTNFAYLQEVESLIDELGLADRVQWTGHQSDAEVGADLNSCDLLVMPYTDGASLRRGTLMAGLANGCAIVTTTPQAPLPELVDERDLLYVAPDNDAALARAIGRLLNNPQLAAQLRTHARTRSQLFTWENIARQHVECYQRVQSTGTRR